MLTVHIEPDNETRTFPKLATVLQLLQRLHLRVNDALVIREAELLTPDRALADGETLRIRKVISTG
jgi:sulfur carrier protein